MIIGSTIKDIEFVKEKLGTPYCLSPAVVEGLLSVNGCSTLVEDGTNTASILYALAMNDSRSGTLAKVIAVWGITEEKAISLLLSLDSTVSEVHLSSQCVDYLKLARSKGQWTRLETIITPDISSYVDESTYSYKFKQLHKSFVKVSNYLDGADPRRTNWLDAEHCDILNKTFTEGLVEHYPGVYSFPLLSKFMCKTLLDKAKEYKYKVNSCEDVPYQMPEVVLSSADLSTYYKLVSLFNTMIPSLTHSMYSCKHSSIKSIQLAKYSAYSVSEGNWHTDMDSDLTLVVALNEGYLGGGTAIKPYGSESEVVVSSLPAGHALLFRGKHFMHKGLPITKGSRDILVFWAVS